MSKPISSSARPSITRIALSALAWLTLPVLVAQADEPAALFPDKPWIHHPGDDLDVDPMERLYGVDVGSMDIEPFWQDGNLYTADSYSRGSLAQAGLPPLPAMNYDPAPGILFVAMEGVTLTPTCPSGDTANSALDCSPLVDSETTFPPYGSGAQQSSTFETLRNYYDPFDLVLTTSRPPHWVPYTMAVIGGSAGLAGLGGGTCGVANVACDGLKRNHVSLTFPASCGGVPEIAAQETSHNWGLEHTDNQTDLLFPFANGGFKTFVDDCMTISHATGDGITQCDYIHEIYCPNDGGEVQNTFQELMGVFGPRQPDSVLPEIISLEPADGSSFDSAESVLFTAQVSEDSNFLAAKWTLEGGGEEPTTRCTNKTCDLDFNVGVGFDPNEIAWDFVTLQNAPPGEYTATFEVIDAYGNYAMQSVTIEITGDGPPSESDSESGPDTASGTDSGPDTASGTDSGPDDDGDPDDDNDDDDDDDDDGDTDSGVPQNPDGDSNCACRGGDPQPLTLLGLALFGLVFVRRRS